MAMVVRPEMTTNDRPMSRRQRIQIVCVMTLFLDGVLAAPKTTVVFVEHGAAKSVIAAAYFNKLASERHLPFHAIAGGTAPQSNISPAAINGLNADGVAFAKGRRRLLTAADAAAA